jgi:hypothetical protein
VAPAVFRRDPAARPAGFRPVDLARAAFLPRFLPAFRFAAVRRRLAPARAAAFERAPLLRVDAVRLRPLLFAVFFAICGISGPAGQPLPSLTEYP